MSNNNLMKIRKIYKVALFQILEERKDILHFLNLYDCEKKLWGGFCNTSYLRFCENCGTYGTAQESILKWPVIQYRGKKMLCKKCRLFLKKQPSE